MPTSPYKAFLEEGLRLLSFQATVISGAMVIARLAEDISASRPEADVVAELVERLNLKSLGRLPDPNVVLADPHGQVLREMLAARYVDNFLGYVVELLALVFSMRPEMLKSGEHVKVDFVLSYPDKDSLVRALIERRINRLSYLGMTELEKDLKQRIGMALFENQDDRERAVELNELRNVIVHNRGVINRRAAHRAPRLATRIGQKVDVSFENLDSQRKFLDVLAKNIDERAIKIFKLTSS